MASSKTPDFSLDMGQGPAAASTGAARQALAQAGSLFAQSSEQMGGAISTGIAGGYTLGMDLYKGKLLHDEGQAIKQAQKDFIEAIPASNADAQNAISQGGSNPAGQFNSTVDRLYAAMQQGKLNTQAYQLRLDNIVKEYSAKMPGWAQDFRRKAQDLQGVSTISAAMSKAAQVDEQAKADWEFAMKQEQAIMGMHGYQDRREITQEDRQLYADKVKANETLAALDTQHKMQVLNDEQTMKNASGQVGAIIAGGLNSLQVSYQQFVTANGSATLEGADQAAKLGQRYAVQIDDAERMAKQKILELRMSKTNPLSFADAKALEEQVSSTFNGMRKNLQDQNGLNVFNTINKNAQGSAEKAMSDLRIANPMLDVFIKGGVWPKMTDDYFRLNRDPKVMEQQFGPVVAQTLHRVYSATPGLAAQSYVAMTQNGVPASQIAAVAGKDVADVTVHSIVEETKAGHKTAQEAVGGHSSLINEVNLGTPTGQKQMDDLLASEGFTKKDWALMDKTQADQIASAWDMKGKAAQQQSLVEVQTTLGRLGVGGTMKFNSRGRMMFIPGTFGTNSKELQDAARNYNRALSLRELVQPHMEQGGSLEEVRGQGPQFLLDDLDKIAAEKKAEWEKLATPGNPSDVEGVVVADRNFEGPNPMSATHSAWKDWQQAQARADAVQAGEWSDGDPKGIVMPTTPAERATAAQTRAAAALPEASNADIRRVDNALEAQMPAHDKIPASTMLAIRLVESGGRNVKNPGKGMTATGPDQIIDATWNRFKGKAAKALGKSVKDMDRGNAEDSEMVARMNIAAGRANLADPDMDLTPVDDYALHHFGDGAGPKVVEAGSRIKMVSLIGKAAMKANFIPEGMTVGQWRAKMQNRMDEHLKAHEGRGGSKPAPATIGVRG